MSQTSQCIEWFEYADILHTRMYVLTSLTRNHVLICLRLSRSEQSQALSKYLPASLVAVSLLIANDSVPQFAYPREESEVWSRQQRSRAVAAQLKARSGGEADLDMLTPLLSVIHPPIRTVLTLCDHSRFLIRYLDQHYCVATSRKGGVDTRGAGDVALRPHIRPCW